MAQIPAMYHVERSAGILWWSHAWYVICRLFSQQAEEDWERNKLPPSGLVRSGRDERRGGGKRKIVFAFLLIHSLPTSTHVSTINCCYTCYRHVKVTFHNTTPTLHAKYHVICCNTTIGTFRFQEEDKNEYKI